MKYDIYKGRKILITGASSGIGFEFTKLLNAHECVLILVALRFEQLENIKDNLSRQGMAKVYYLRADLSKVNDIEELYQTLKTKDLIPDILINNAGRQSHGYFYKLDWEGEYNQVVLNCITPMYLIYKILPLMSKNGFGKILNVGSVAGTMPGPFFATYAASKAFLNSFSQAISVEMRAKGIQCTCLLPGKTNCKEFWNLPALTKRISDTSMFASPRSVALYGLRLLERNKDYGVHGLRNKITQFIKLFVPRRVLNCALRRHSYRGYLEDI